MPNPYDHRSLSAHDANFLKLQPFAGLRNFKEHSEISFAALNFLHHSLYYGDET
jgi:hypothetical protein